MPLPRVDRSLLDAWELRVERQLELAGLRAWRIGVPADLRVPAHEHEEAFFCALASGSFESGYARKSIAFDPSLAVFHPAGTVHTSNAGGRGADIVTLEATPGWLKRLDGLAALPSGPVVVGAEDGCWLMRRLARELSMLLPCSALVVEGLALELLAAATRTQPTRERPRWLGRVLERLHEEPGARLTVRDLAVEVGVAPTRLSTEFRRHTGRTVGGYRRALQVETVMRRLRDPRSGAEPLSSIALDAGFADQAHCTRVFKGITGTTPGRFRARAIGQPIRPSLL